MENVTFLVHYDVWVNKTYSTSLFIWCFIHSPRVFSQKQFGTFFAIKIRCTCYIFFLQASYLRIWYSVWTPTRTCWSVCNANVTLRHDLWDVAPPPSTQTQSDGETLQRPVRCWSSVMWCSRMLKVAAETELPAPNRTFHRDLVRVHHASDEPSPAELYNHTACK